MTFNKEGYKIATRGRLKNHVLSGIFWNVDTQYDFMRDDISFKGALPVPGARSIEENLEMLTEFATDQDISVVNTADWHTSTSAEFSPAPDYKITFPPHCLMHSQGARFVPATQPRDKPYEIDWRSKTVDAVQIRETRNIVLYKDAFDVFTGNPFTETVLHTLLPPITPFETTRAVIVYGVAANVCVRYAVQGLHRKGVEVAVVKDAIKELPGQPLEDLLAAWKKEGIRIMTTQEIVSEEIGLNLLASDTILRSG